MQPRHTSPYQFAYKRCRLLLEALEDRLPPGDLLGWGLLTDSVPATPAAGAVPPGTSLAPAASWPESSRDQHIVTVAPPPAAGRPGARTPAPPVVFTMLSNEAHSFELPFTFDLPAHRPNGSRLPTALASVSVPALGDAAAPCVAPGLTGADQEASVLAAALTDAGDSAELLTLAGLGTPPGTAGGVTLRQISLAANDLVYNPSDGLIYASVGSRAGACYGNTITAIDPNSGEIVTATHAGSEPNKLAISDDGQYVYVGLDGAAAISRLDTTTGMVDQRFPLTTSPDVPTFVEDLAVQPGNPNVIAVARQDPNYSPRHAGTVVYENGVRRPNLVREGNVIEFGDTPERVYGYNSETTAFGFSRMRLDATGMNLVDVVGNLITGFGVDMTYAAGRIYATSGRVIEAEQRVLAGTYSASGLVRPDVDANRTYILQGSTLNVFNLTTFAFLEAHPLAGVSGARSLIRWGDNGLAFATPGTNRVYFVTFGGDTGPGSDFLIPRLCFARPVRLLSVRQVALRTNDLVYDPQGGLIYASVPGSAGARGNTITPINPVSGTLGNSVFVGSEPSKLALSDDSQFIYVGLNGAGAVRRFNVPTQTADIQISLAQPPEAPRFPEDLAVVPGNPRAVAVSTNRPGSPRHAGLFLFEDGVRRPDVASQGNTIEFGDDPGRLYAYNNEISSFGFTRLAVDANGIRVIDGQANLIYGYGQDLKYAGGRLYTQMGGGLGRVGRTIDPETRLVEGTFWDVPTNAYVAPDAEANRVSYVFGNTLRVYNLSTFVPLGQVTIPGLSGQVTSLVRWGSNGLAFRTSGDQVFLVTIR